MKHRLFPIILAALIAWGGLCAWGQTEIPEIRCEGYVGLDGGRIVESSFNPFHLIFTNTLEDFEGTLEVWVTRAVEERPRQRVALVYERSFDLPMNSRKMVEGLVFVPEEETELEIRLIDQDGRVHSTYYCGFGTLTLERRVILVVDRQGNQWQTIRTARDAIPCLGRQIIPINPERFPKHWAALAPASTILWDGDRWPADPHASTALGEWLNRGGVLVVGLGATWPLVQTTPLIDHLPLEVGEAAAEEPGSAEGPVPLNVAEALVMASIDESSLPSGSRTLCELGGRPLLITWPVGDGHVVLSTASLQSLWRSAHSDRETLNALITSPQAPRIPHGPLDESLTEISRGIAQIGRVNLPDADVIGRWLIILWLIVVPGAFALAWAIRRPRWAWFFSPAFALIATAQVFRIGLGGILPHQPVQQVQLITCSPTNPQADLRGVVSIYAPLEETYSIRFNDDDVALGPLMGAGAVTGAQEVYRLAPGHRSGLLNFRMPYGALRSMTTDAVVENPLPVAIHATPGETPSEMTVAWDAPLGPHGEHWFALWNGLAHPISAETTWTSGSILINSERGRNLGHYMPLYRGEVIERELAAAIVAGLQSALRRESNRISPICLIGLRDESLLELSVTTQRGSRQIHDELDAGTAVMIAPVPMENTGQSTLPWSRWQREVHLPENQFGYEERGEQYNLATNGRHDVGLVFSPRFDTLGNRDFNQITLNMTTRSSGYVNTFNRRGTQPTNQGNTKTNVALLDWQNQEWVQRTTNPQLDEFTWVDPSQYVHPVTGDIVGALWVNVQSSVIPIIPDKDEDWLWSMGPMRDRTATISGTTANVQLIDFTVTGDDEPPEERAND